MLFHMQKANGFTTTVSSTFFSIPLIRLLLAVGIEHSLFYHVRHDLTKPTPLPLTVSVKSWSTEVRKHRIQSRLHGNITDLQHRRDRRPRVHLGGSPCTPQILQILER